jgi:F0F1-type ATP synthase delta subunit
MSIKTKEFFNKMLEFIPSTVDEYNNSINEHGELLETIVVEDVFMPEIIKLLSKNENTHLLKKIFEYFEKVSNCEDEKLLNIFSVTVLEVLGNDKGILEIAQTYMGKKTYELQLEADKDLGRI